MHMCLCCCSFKLLGPRRGPWGPPGGLAKVWNNMPDSTSHKLAQYVQ